MSGFVHASFSLHCFHPSSHVSSVISSKDVRRKDTFLKYWNMAYVCLSAANVIPITAQSTAKWILLLLETNWLFSRTVTFTTCFTFLVHFQVHEYLRSKLCSLYENDCIFDKFECCWNGSDRSVQQLCQHQHRKHAFKLAVVHHERTHHRSNERWFPSATYQFNSMSFI